MNELSNKYNTISFSNDRCFVVDDSQSVKVSNTHSISDFYDVNNAINLGSQNSNWTSGKNPLDYRTEKDSVTKSCYSGLTNIIKLNSIIRMLQSAATPEGKKYLDGLSTKLLKPIKSILSTSEANVKAAVSDIRKLVDANVIDANKASKLNAPVLTSETRKLLGLNSKGNLNMKRSAVDQQDKGQANNIK